MKCLFSISRGNIVPERGFSINKLLLDTHGSSTENDMIIDSSTENDLIIDSSTENDMINDMKTLQMVKENILSGACIMKVSVNKQLLSFVNQLDKYMSET